jgi:iron-sulfur cluster assembly accessory protein
MLTMTPKAIAKVKQMLFDHLRFANPEWLAKQPKTTLRLSVMGGGCSGFQYSMAFEIAIEKGPMDKSFDFDGLTVHVDATSYMYLDGCEVDYLETLESSGFKFNNPNVKSTCGCGSSFNA